MATHVEKSYLVGRRARAALVQEEERWPPFASFCFTTAATFALWFMIAQLLRTAWVALG